MTRPLLLFVVALLLHSAQAALAVLLGTGGLPVAPAVVLLAYIALAERPVEAAMGALLLGLVLDALSGSMLGVNMLACLLALLAGRFFSGAATPHGGSAFVFGAGMSLGYHLFLLLLLSVFGADRESLTLLDIVLVALVDGALAVVLMPVLHRMFVALGLEEEEHTMSERLSSRVTRSRSREKRS